MNVTTCEGNVASAGRTKRAELSAAAASLWPLGMPLVAVLLIDAPGRRVAIEIGHRLPTRIGLPLTTKT